MSLILKSERHNGQNLKSLKHARMSLILKSERHNGIHNAALIIKSIH